MAEPTEDTPALTPVDYRRVVAEILDNVEEEGEWDGDRYGRGGLSQPDQERVLGYLASFVPEVRANVYLSYGLEAMTTPETMTDAAVFIYAFAWQDHEATQAVEASRVQGVEQGGYDPNGVFVDPDWYMDHIAHHGDGGQAREYLKNMFGAGASDDAPTSLPGRILAGGFQYNQMDRIYPDAMMQTIDDGLSFRRDEFEGMKTAGDMASSAFETVLEGISYIATAVAAVQGIRYDLSRYNAGPSSPFKTEPARQPGGSQAFSGPYSSAPGPLGKTGAGAVARATRQAMFHPFSTIRHGFAPRPPSDAMSALEVAGINRYRPFAHAAIRAGMSPEDVIGLTATYSPTGARMANAADWMYQSRFVPTSYTQIAATWLFGNLASSVGLAKLYPELVDRTAEDVERQRSEYNARYTDAYQAAIAEGLDPEEAKQRAREETGRSEPSEGGPWLAGVEGDQAMGASSPATLASTTATIDGAEESTFTYEEAKALRRREMDEVNNRVEKVNLRIQAVSDVAASQQDEYQRRYDRLKEENPGWSEAILDKEASKGLLTDDEIDDAVADVQSGSDVSTIDTVSSPSTVTGELLQWMDRYQWRLGDGRVGASEQVQPGEDYFEIPNPAKPDEWLLIIGPEMTTTQRSELTEITQAKEPENDPDMRPAPIGETNPYLGYGEGFRRKLETKYNAASMEERLAPDGAEQWRYKPVMAPIPTNGRSGFGGGSAGGNQQYQVSASPTYRESDVRDLVASMSSIQIFKYQQQALDAGLYTYDKIPVHGHISSVDIPIIANIMIAANGSNLQETRTFWGMLNEYAKTGRAYTEAAKKANQPTAPIKQPFSVPGHLRSIPGEKTVAEETKARFREKMGRNARPDELAGIADELTGYYQRSNQEEIALYLAAYNGDNQGLLTGAQMQRIEDPGAATSFDIADTYANEIDLNARRESNSDTFQKMLGATLGNRPSVGNLTAAGGVNQIGRR